MSGSDVTPFSLQDSYTDSGTKFLYLINRYYDPATGQFISVDPDVMATGQPYAFTGDNPLNATDPLGLIAPYNARHWSKRNLPKVKSEKVERFLKAVYKHDPGKGHIGNGSTPAAIENEALTGRPTETAEYKGSTYRVTCRTSTRLTSSSILTWIVRMRGL